MKPAILKYSAFFFYYIWRGLPLQMISSNYNMFQLTTTLTNSIFAHFFHLQDTTVLPRWVNISYTTVTRQYDESSGFSSRCVHLLLNGWKASGAITWNGAAAGNWSTSKNNGETTVFVFNWLLQSDTVCNQGSRGGGDPSALSSAHWCTENSSYCTSHVKKPYLLLTSPSLDGKNWDSLT